MSRTPLRSRPGQQSWVARQLLSSLVDLPDRYRPRVTRGLQYAAGGRVSALNVRPGTLSAVVNGSEPYRVAFTVVMLSQRDWRIAAEALTGNGELKAELRAGRLPAGVQTLFRDCARSLVPKHVREIGMSCTCPDDRLRGICKHTIAVLRVFADHAERQPDALFVWRGMSVDRFITLADRVAQGDAGLVSADAAAQPLSEAQRRALERFWLGRELPAAPKPAAPKRPGRLLRRHGPLPRPHEHPAILHALHAAYELFAGASPSTTEPAEDGRDRARCRTRSDDEHNSSRSTNSLAPWCADCAPNRSRTGSSKTAPPH